MTLSISSLTVSKKQYVKLTFQKIHDVHRTIALHKRKIPDPAIVE